MVSQPEKIQRRQYYRLEYVHDIEYRLVTEEEIKLEDKLLNDKGLDTETSDIIRENLTEMNKNWIRPQ